MALARRDFVLGLSGALGSAIAQPRKQPNIIFLLADDLGYGIPGCYGQKQVLTPHLDRMAAEGMRFTQAYSGSTVCAPSRCSLMTGLHTGHGRVRGNKGPEVPLAPSDLTVPELLKKAGYKTGLFGKWGLGDAGTTGRPNLKGFDEFFGYHTQMHAHTYYPHMLWENDREHLLARNFGVRDRIWAQDLFVPRAKKFIDSCGSNPFFAYIAFTTPHANNELGQDTGNGMEVPDLGVYADKPWPAPEKGFAAMVTRMDRDIGVLFDHLKARGLDGDTIVFFSSDNGPHKEGGHDPEFFNDNGPLRGIKRDLYEGGVRVPFLARAPGRIAPGVVSDQPIAFWDLLPTAAALAGAPTPRGVDGVSFVPALEGKKLPSRPPLYWEFHELGFSQAVRDGGWKAVRLGRRSAKVELFNLTSDPGETTDVSAANPGVLARLSTLLDTSRTESKDFPVKELPV